MPPVQVVQVAPTATPTTAPQAAPTQTPVATPTAAYTPTAAPQPATATPLDPVLQQNAVEIGTAWGTTPPIQQVAETLDADHFFVANMVTPDSKFLLGTVFPRNIDSTEPSTLALMNIATHTVQEIRRYSSKEDGSLGMDADEEWIVWSEAAQPPNFEDWTIYAYHRPTQVIKEIATAPTDAEGRPLGSRTFVMPRVDHGVVVWQAPQPQAEQGETVWPSVYMADLTTGETTHVADNGVAPDISWPYIGWVETQTELSEQLEGAYKGVLVVRNMETGETKHLQKPDTPSGFRLYHDTIVWTRGDGKAVVLTDVDETYEQVLIQAQREEQYYQYPTVSERFVAWWSNEQAFAWDRKQQRLIALTEVDRQEHRRYLPMVPYSHGRKAFLTSTRGTTKCSIRARQLRIICCLWMQRNSHKRYTFRCYLNSRSMKSC